MSTLYKIAFRTSYRLCHDLTTYTITLK